MYADDEPMGLGPSRGALAELHRLTLNAQSLAFHSQDHSTNGTASCTATAHGPNVMLCRGGSQ